MARFLSKLAHCGQCEPPEGYDMALTPGDDFDGRNKSLIGEIKMMVGKFRGQLIGFQHDHSSELKMDEHGKIQIILEDLARYL